MIKKKRQGLLIFDHIFKHKIDDQSYLLWILGFFYGSSDINPNLAEIINYNIRTINHIYNIDYDNLLNLYWFTGYLESNSRIKGYISHRCGKKGIPKFEIHLNDRRCDKFD